MTCSQSADPPGPHNHPTSPTRAVRLAMAAGPLTAPLLARREQEARNRGRHLLDVLTEAEALHLHFIQRTMPLGLGWEDALDAIRQSGRA